MFLFLQFSHLKLQNVSVYIVFLDFQCFGHHCSKYFPLSCTVHWDSPLWYQISHAAVSVLCRSIKLQCELYSSRQITICLDPLLWTWFLCSGALRGNRWIHTNSHIQMTHSFVSSHAMACSLQNGYEYVLRYYKPEMCLSFTVYIQVISPSWSLLWSWRARWPCG